MPRKREYTKQREVPSRKYLQQLGEALQEIAESDRPAFEQPIDPNVADWAASGIRRYLSDEISDLERALDLRPKAGRPRLKASEEEIILGREIFDLLVAKKSWHKIADEINWQGDESSLRELWQRIEPDINQVVIDELTKKLSENK